MSTKKTSIKENEIILFVKDIFSFKKDNANAKKKENVHIAKITST